MRQLETTGGLRKARSGLEWVAALAVVLAGCHPVTDPSAGQSPEQAAALVDRAPAAAPAQVAVADAFALGNRTTPARIADLERGLVGHQVTWDVTVADVGFSDDRFEIASRPLPVSSRDTVPVLRVMAFVRPRDEIEQRRLMALHPDEVVRVRGIVQEIRSGRMVAIVPAVLEPAPR